MFGVGTTEIIVGLGLLVVVAVVVLALRGPIVRVADEMEVNADPALVEERVFGTLGQVHGASMTRAAAGQVSLVTRRSPTWAVFLAVLLFPWGLVLLFVREEHELQVRVVARGEGAVVGVSGRATKRVAKQVGEVLERRLAPAPSDAA